MVQCLHNELSLGPVWEPQDIHSLEERGIFSAQMLELCTSVRHNQHNSEILAYNPKEKKQFMKKHRVKPESYIYILFNLTIGQALVLPDLDGSQNKGKSTIWSNWPESDYY